MKPYAEAKREWLRGYLQQALASCERSVTKAARLIGVNRQHFYTLCKRAGLNPCRQGRGRYGNKGNAAWRALA